jgi:hypothetical protein
MVIINQAFRHQHGIHRTIIRQRIGGEGGNCRAVTQK